MAYLKTMQVKSTGHSKCLWLDKSWGIEKGDMLCIQITIDGKNYIQTTSAKENCSKFVTLPKFWPVEVGDIIDVKITYANVPQRDYESIKVVKNITDSPESESLPDDELEGDEDEDDDEDDDEEEDE